jgi:hypothetical protein
MSNVDLNNPENVDNSVAPVFPPDKIVVNVEEYNDNVKHYFETKVGASILALPQADKERCFQMFKDYADILNTILIPGIDILEHVIGERFSAANSNPHDGIDFDYDCPIIREYEEWEANQN